MYTMLHDHTKILIAVFNLAPHSKTTTFFLGFCLHPSYMLVLVSSARFEQVFLFRHCACHFRGGDCLPPGFLLIRTRITVGSLWRRRLGRILCCYERKGSGPYIYLCYVVVCSRKRVKKVACPECSLLLGEETPLADHLETDHPGQEPRSAYSSSQH